MAQTPGVRGWLTLVCVYLRIILPILSIFAAVGYYPILRGSLDLAGGIVLLDGIARIVIAVISYSVGTALYRIATGASKRAQVALVAIIVYNIIISFLLFAVIGPTRTASVGVAIGSAIGTAFFPFLALLYLRLSKRVAYTYGNADKVDRSHQENVPQMNPSAPISRSTFGGWQRLWVVVSVVSFIAFALIAFDDVQKVDSLIADCIPEAQLQNLLVKIPAGVFREMPSGEWFAVELGSTQEETVRSIETLRPYTKGKLSKYVAEAAPGLGPDADPNSHASDPLNLAPCPSGRLRPLPTVRNKYAQQIESTRHEIWWRNATKDVPIALSVWLGLVVGLYLCGILIGWVIDGFRQRK